MNQQNTEGIVYLVGAGPGDPGLITVKGLACIRKADVLVYDYLANPALLEHARPDAEILYVGKKGGDHTLSQEGINRLLVEKAGGGRIVTRLKGGDPFIFGRGGEEAEVLIEAGIAYEIVPGVTSAIAAPAYAGIPLTHRDFTSTLAFVTGHEDPQKTESQIDWESLARGIGTLVFLMGVKNLPRIAAKLLQFGKSPQTPVALVRWGTTPRQVTVTGTLETIVAQVKAAGLKAPAIIIVGEVVRLREQLAWFEKRPLLGKRVVVTRARAQASDLVRQLSGLGAECLEFPTIAIEPPDDIGPLDDAIDRLAGYQWIVFTSVNGVGHFFERLFARGKDLRALGHLRTVAIGPATAARMRSHGLLADIVPESYRAESIIEAFRHEDVGNCRILLPRAEQARPILPVELEQMGARVDEVTAYRSRPVKDKAEALIDLLEAGKVNLITFTSSSTAANFKAMLPPERFEDLLQGVVVASIGPITTETALKLGFNVHLTAREFTIEGLCRAIVEHFAA
jgi:uroporphyrinogen III methyltransferase/synthase